MPNLPVMSPGVRVSVCFPIQFLPVDLSREADDLGGHRPVEILPHGSDLHHHAGEFEGVGFHHGQLFHADVLFEDHGHKGLHPAGERVERGDGQGSFGVEGLDLVEDPVDVLRPVGDEDEIEGGLVVHQDPPVGIHDQTAHRLDLPQADAVVFGTLPQLAPLDDLQIPQPHHEERQRDRDDDEQDPEFAFELTRLITVEPVVYLLHAEKPRIGGKGRRRGGSGDPPRWPAG